MITTSTIPAALESARAYAASLDAVASVEIWDPSAEEISAYAADGIIAGPRLEITIWRSERNAHDTVCAIEALGLERIGEGTGHLGQCYSFVVKAA